MDWFTSRWKALAAIVAGVISQGIALGVFHGTALTIATMVNAALTVPATVYLAPKNTTTSGVPDAKP